MEAVLDALPDGASVAVVWMLGSLCPITLGHVQCYIEARHILLGDMRKKAPRPVRLENFDECIGFVYLNGDHSVKRKMESKGQKHINEQDRAKLVRLATAELAWLNFAEDYTDGHHRFFLEKRWPSLRFFEFDMNGADDVVKFGKWKYTDRENRMITIGRPSFTELVLDGMKECGIDQDDGYCFLGPELLDISSTGARDASSRGDQEVLLEYLHPAVADWMLRRDGHAGVVDLDTLLESAAIAAAATAAASVPAEGSLPARPAPAAGAKAVRKPSTARSTRDALARQSKASVSVASTKSLSRGPRARNNSGPRTRKNET